MGSSAQLVLVAGAIHVAGLALALVLLLPILRGDRTTFQPPWDDGDDGGGNDRRRPPTPSSDRGGGLPLPDAQPARARLRGPGRLSDARRANPRRPAREPERPHRRAPTGR
jgi:hypothetical protein